MKLQAVFRSNMAMDTPNYLNDIKTIEVSKIREIPLLQRPWSLTDTAASAILDLPLRTGPVAAPCPGTGSRFRSGTDL